MVPVGKPQILKSARGRPGFLLANDATSTRLPLTPRPQPPPVSSHGRVLACSSETMPTSPMPQGPMPLQVLSMTTLTLGAMCPSLLLPCVESRNATGNPWTFWPQLGPVHHRVAVQHQVGLQLQPSPLD